MRCKNKKRYTRPVAVLTLLATLISALFFNPIPTHSEAEAPLYYLSLNGEKTDFISLHSDEKITLEAASDFTENVGYCWQLRDPENTDRWISISNVYSSRLTVSAPLILSMTDQQGQSAIRCRLSANGIFYYTEPVILSLNNSLSKSNVQAVDNASTLFNVSSTVRLRAAAAPTSEEPVHTTHSIVINYLFDNNAIAFEPYGASVATGSDFTASIPSPKVVGYAPYRRIGEDYVKADTVELNYTNIQEDITINVIYEPALVNFSVHHHLQNLLDDDYSIQFDRITNGQALTGSTVGDGLALTEAQLPGFKALPYEHLTVAADGSTVIEIRYDRIYYLVDFDMNGGYGTEPVYTRYGATVGANIPVRHGYVFDGWELISYGGEAPTPEQQAACNINNGPITVPAANLRYRARWITQETNYTLVFWKENANDNNYSYWGYLDDLKAMSGSYVSGQDRISEVPGIDDEKYFTFNAQKTDKNVLIEGDGSTVINVYYTRNFYKLTFKDADYNACTIPTGHTHGNDCYDLICGQEVHVHDESCEKNLLCTIPEHQQHTDACRICNLPEHTVHTSECLICGLAEHTHGSSCCGLAEHQHVKACWGSNASTTASTTQIRYAPSNPVNGQVYRRSAIYSPVIYINGTWYVYTGRGASSGDTVLPTCGSEAHLHGTDCSCSVQPHTHSAACYKDVIHTHTEACYRNDLHTHTDPCYSYSCGENDHTHVSACYRLKCGIPENHVHGTACRDTIRVVYRKYEQSLDDLWPVTDDNGVTYNNGERWDPGSSSIYTEVLVYIATMPGENFTLTLDDQSRSYYTMNYYQQVLPGAPYDVTYNGYQYKLADTIKAKYNHITKAEDFFDIHGFNQYASDPSFGTGSSISPSDKIADFYYNRITDHVLSFNNNGTVVREETGIMYELPLAQYRDFVPEYPDNLEPNAYEFEGWYISPKCFPGTEVNWDTVTMPAGDLLLYANWVPITHTVKIYKDATLTEQIGADQTVDHQAFAYAPTDAVHNGNYIFQGWFYLDSDGTEKAFIFNGIPIIKDMNIYAKWSSHVSVNYKINYVLKQTGEPIADPTFGSSIAGHNKTFDAKAGEDLYANFQTGYYPLTNSHTITMSVDGNHEFTFEYVFVPSMPYLVRYVDAVTGAPLFPDKRVDNNNLSVVTETFQHVDGKMPDAYQKRLILSADSTDENNDGIYDDNVITFYYTADEVHAYYRVVHYIQNIAADGYREYRSEELVGEIGTTYLIEAISLTGFNFVPEKATVIVDNNTSSAHVDGNVVSATLGAQGMLVELYYDRITYPYTVRYLDVQTNQEISSPKVGSGLFGKPIMENALDLTDSGYQLVSDSTKSINLSANAEHNVLEFFYQERLISLKYQIMGPQGCGALTQSSENVSAITGTANGSQPIINEGFAFVGWFTDSYCTVPVDPALIDSATHHLTPAKNGTVWSEAVYYAKFIPLKTSLTIQNRFVQESDEQAFFYRITGVSGTPTEGIDLTLSIQGNRAATVRELPLGDYTVTQLSDWSWRYETAAQTVGLTLGYSETPHLLTVDNNRTQPYWLDGNAVAVNQY